MYNVDGVFGGGDWFLVVFKGKVYQLGGIREIVIIHNRIQLFRIYFFDSHVYTVGRVFIPPSPIVCGCVCARTCAHDWSE